MLTANSLFPDTFSIQENILINIVSEYGRFYFLVEAQRVFTL